MNEKHPNRKKDKHNPYTLMIVEGRYYLSFKDGRGIMQNIEIDKVLYDLFNRFELEDISYLNRVSRHIEHSELTESSLNDRAFYKEESLEETVSRCIEYELRVNKLVLNRGRHPPIPYTFYLLVQTKPAKIFGVELCRDFYVICISTRVCRPAATRR